MFDVHGHAQNLVLNSFYVIAHPGLTTPQCRAPVNHPGQSCYSRRKMLMIIALEDIILFGSATDFTIGIPLSESSDMGSTLRSGSR